jgi:hypothetical protein
MAEQVEMETVIRHSRVRATEEAIVLWAIASAQYPLHPGPNNRNGSGGRR